jgi:hypothetical protein
MSPFDAKRWVCVLPLLAAVSCFELPEFAQSSFIDRPRILAVVAEPPEVSPSSTASATLSILVAGADEVTDVRWTACGMPGGMGFGGMGNMFGENEGDSGCGSAAVPLGEGERVMLPLDQARVLLMSDDIAQAALGSALSPEVLEQIRTSVGIAATIQVELLADGKRLRAVKRVLLRESDTPGSNPPPPTFRFGETILRSQGDVPPYRCVPDQGSLQVGLRESVALVPVFDGDTEPWLESYSVLDATGMLGERKEQAFYSWFSDAGELDDGSTRAPSRANSWRAPDKPGCAQLWLVVRDGHAGSTACSARISVGADGSCEEE